MKVQIIEIEKGFTPVYKHQNDACCDCMAHINKDFQIEVGKRAKIPLGFAIGVPEGFEAVVRPRSGLSLQGIDIAPGTIDCGYTNEVSAVVINNSDKPFVVHYGDRICQMKIQRAEQFEFEKVKELPDSDRGKNGFGSSGI